MPLTVNLRHLEAHNLELEGELPVEELHLDVQDEMIQAEKPLGYDLEVQKLEDGLLVHGRLHLPLACHCVRCLKAFLHEISLDNWTRHLPFHGEDQVQINNDLVDLTPYVREDILLAFPQHPLCETDCRGLPTTETGKAKKTDPDTSRRESSAWAELDKLKF